MTSIRFLAILLHLFCYASFLNANVYLKLEPASRQTIYSFEVLAILDTECRILAMENEIPINNDPFFQSSQNFYILTDDQFRRLQYLWIRDYAFAHQTTCVPKSQLLNLGTTKGINRFMKIPVPEKKIDQRNTVPDQHRRILIQWDPDFTEIKSFFINFDRKNDLLELSTFPHAAQNQFNFDFENRISVLSPVNMTKDVLYLFLKKNGHLPVIVKAMITDQVIDGYQQVYEIRQDPSFNALGAYVDYSVQQHILNNRNAAIESILIWDDTDPFQYETTFIVDQNYVLLFQNQEKISLPGTIPDNSQIIWINSSFSEAWTKSVEDSIPFYMNLKNDPPNPFSLLDPPNGSLIRQENIQFAWEARGDPDPPDFQISHFLINMDSNIGKICIIDPDTLSEFTVNRNCYFAQVPRPKQPGVYYWFVEAYDNMDSSRISNDVLTFIVPEPLSIHLSRDMVWSYQSQYLIPGFSRENSPERNVNLSNSLKMTIARHAVLKNGAVAFLPTFNCDLLFSFQSNGMGFGGGLRPHIHLREKNISFYADVEFFLRQSTFQNFNYYFTSQQGIWVSPKPFVTVRLYMELNAFPFLINSTISGHETVPGIGAEVMYNLSVIPFFHEGLKRLFPKTYSTTQVPMGISYTRFFDSFLNLRDMIGFTISLQRNLY